MSVSRTIVVALGLAATTSSAPGQAFDVGTLVLDYKVVAAEEAAAKAIRLKWIEDERMRIRQELREYEAELDDLREVVPDPVKPRNMAPARAVRHEEDEKRFNEWAASNDSDRRAAVTRGTGLNAMLRVLGPIAHYRTQRGAGGTAGDTFPSLAASRGIGRDEVSRYVMNPATSSGSTFVVRLNQAPLEIRWPTTLCQFWEGDCRRVETFCKCYREALGSGPQADVNDRLDRWKLFDDSAKILQAKVLAKRAGVSRVKSASFDAELYFRLTDGVRYLETLRATADRFKEVPSDYAVRSFEGGTVEAFLDYCYTHGMVFEAARPADEEAYHALFRRMQDYARDVQYVEDWKGDVEQRIAELTAIDRSLVWSASER